MTLEEAIKHCEEVAEEHTKYNFYGGYESCDECGKEHRQLAKWLKELKAYREDRHSCELCKYEERAENQIPCADCKHNHMDYFECRG